MMVIETTETVETTGTAETTDPTEAGKAVMKAHWASRNPLEQTPEQIAGDLYCAVCEQEFKNRHGVRSHLGSKKHLKKHDRIKAQQDAGAPSAVSESVEGGGLMSFDPDEAVKAGGTVEEAKFAAPTEATEPKVKVRLHYDENWPQAGMLSVFMPQYREARGRESAAKVDKEAARDVLKEIVSQLADEYEDADGVKPTEVELGEPFEAFTPTGRSSMKVSIMAYQEGQERLSADRLLELGVDPEIVEQAKVRSPGYWTVRDVKA